MHLFKEAYHYLYTILEVDEITSYDQSLKDISKQVNMSEHSKYKHFPDWKYGYTLGPPTAANSGNYTIFDDTSSKCVVDANNKTKAQVSNEEGINETDHDSSTDKLIIDESKLCQTSEEACNDSKASQQPSSSLSKAADSITPTPSTANCDPPLKEETDEPSLEDILCGRNPIMYCNEQAKILGQTLEWEQISESGPPHDKTFVWACMLNDAKATGTSGTKKGAKTKAAEEIAKIIYKSIIPQLKSEKKRSWYDSEYNRTMNTYGKIIVPSMFGFYNQSDPSTSEHGYGPGSKKMKTDESLDKHINDSSKVVVKEGFQDSNKSSLNTDNCQINPISKLYEHCKKINASEPSFELVQEHVLDVKRAPQGYPIIKSEFTMQCEYLGNQYQGIGKTKKEAKRLAAASAWDAITNQTPTLPKSNDVSKQPATLEELIAQARRQTKTLNE